MSNPFTSLFRKSAAGRDAAMVLAAQAIGTAITLGADSFLFHRLTKTEQGVLSATLALHAVLLQFSDFGLTLTTVRVGSEFRAKNMLGAANAIFRRALQQRIALAFAFGIVASIAAPLLARYPLSEPARPMLVWAAAANLLGTVLICWAVDVAQACRHYHYFFIAHFFGAMLKAAGVIAVVLAVSGSASAEAIMWSTTAANLAAGILFVYLQSDKFAGGNSAVEAGDAANAWSGFGRYAFVAALLTTLGLYADILLVQSLASSEETAVFACARRLAMVLNIVAAAFLIVLLPRAAALTTREECARYAGRALAISLPIALALAGALALAAAILVPAFGSEKYIDSIPILRWLSASYGLLIILNPLSLVFFPLRREKLMIAFAAVHLLLIVTLGCWLVPLYGAAGAAWASLSARAGSLLCLALLLWAAFRGSDMKSRPVEEPLEISQ